MTLELFESYAVAQKKRVNAALNEMPPHSPGVYTMYDANDHVLYVGKAKDLQKRITSYRYSEAKKTQRLIARVANIRFEICNNDTDALLLENLLIRSLRPPFNVVNKKPETYYYISTVRSGNKREFRLSMRVLRDYPKVYGCFKGHLKTRKGLGALLRLLYLLDSKPSNVHFLPAQLLNRITPQKFRVKLDDRTGVLVDQFLKGTSSQLISSFKEMVNNISFTDKFSQSYFENQLEMLEIFFLLGPQRNFNIKTELGLESYLIDQDKLDDLHVLLNNKLLLS